MRVGLDTKLPIRSRKSGLVQIRRFSGNRTDDECALTVQGSQKNRGGEMRRRCPTIARTSWRRSSTTVCSGAGQSGRRRWRRANRGGASVRTGRDEQACCEPKTRQVRSVLSPKSNEWPQRVEALRRQRASTARSRPFPASHPNCTACPGMWQVKELRLLSNSGGSKVF